MFDAVVIGGGSAGLNAGLILGRQRRDVLVVDEGKPRNAPSQAVHGFLSRDGIPPDELLRIARQQLARYPTVEIRDLAVIEATHIRDAFEVRTADGAREQARTLLLATGQVDELPSVDGLAEMFGRGVFHCPYCHGFEAQGLALGVLGNDAFAAALALYLKMRISDDVVLCTNGPATLDAESRTTSERCGIVVREQPIARVEGRKDEFGRIVFKSGDTLSREALFVRAPLRQSSVIAADLGCELWDDGAVKTNDSHQTTVPGVYAAGDMTRPASFPVPLGQSVVAAANGATAAIWLDQELLAADVRARTVAP